MNRRTPARRAGALMAELLACMAIIAVMASLILPAVRTSREAARRIQCVNNLRQLSLAVRNYAASYRVLPPGVVDTAGPVHNRPEGSHVGWVVQLLPFMEQGQLHAAIDPDASVYAASNATVAGARINTLLCPSDPGAARPGRAAPSSYAGCHHDVEAPIDADNHGVFFLNSRVTDASITDGASATIFLGEKPIGPNDLGWMSGTRATLRNTGSPINAPGPPAGDLVGGFGGFHPGGANFAFGDGAVRFLSARIHPDVYRLLGHRADGEPVGSDDF